MSAFWASAWEALAAALLPTPCVSCDALIHPASPPLCDACWRRVGARALGPVCGCGASLPLEASERCGRCRRGLSAVSRGYALGSFEGPLRDAIVAFKYAGRHRTGTGLAARLAEAPGARRVLEAVDALVPVPLHPARERERGYNQSLLLARAIARASGLPVVEALRRARDTPSQTDLSARQCRLNVRDAFSCPSASMARGRTLVLVDDVMTTGATLRECAQTLLGAGAREVRALTGARAE